MRLTRLIIASLMLISSPVSAHDWYGKLLSPQGFPCCNGDSPDRPGDCRPVPSRLSEKGTYQVFIRGAWIDVPPDRVLPGALNMVPIYSHVCEQDWYIRCFLPGGSGS